MARQLKWWIGATVISCAAVALLYLPPRGVRPGPRPRVQAFELSAARLEAQRLAGQWRAADRSARVAEYRLRLEPQIIQHRAAGRRGPVLHIGGSDPVPLGARQILQAALDTLWRQLGLGVTKVSVAVVLDWQGAGAPTGQPREYRPGPAYLLPDSIDRATCMVVIPGGPWLRRLLAPHAENDARFDWPALRLAWLRAGVGPCAFFAAYGAPGEPVRRWLAARRYDVALHPAWNAQGPDPALGWPLVNPATGAWHWDGVYSLPPEAAACLAGRAHACRVALLAGAEGRGLTSPREITTERRWWREERLVQAHRYLGDVAREIGPERFLRFWNSPESVDTALAAALKAPVGAWTERWQRRFAPRLPVGAAVPPSAAVLGILLAGVAIASVVLTVSRREVR